MKNITIALALFLSIGAFSSYAQSSNWKDGNNEINIGIKPFHFGPTSIQYKTKLSQKNWLRMSITDLRVLDGASGFRIGIEKQKNLIMRSRITYGLEPGINFDYDRIDNDFSSYDVDLGIPVGVQIHLSKRLLLGFESRPSIGIYESYVENDSPERVTNFGGGLDFFNGIKTTLGYRF
ncbi:hypothetical protein [Portibacter lacus]|uniref:DUF3575 domain-containing protein n=1 Tax=Portibacter lacus TaxID=1099794 RepID=A0AA37WH02_9BACT|nr:hypothetical protein [Portibacter lacus]GLR18360.1 hypothetical protein GCM10007940_29760 [Portibacter lacus]